jgi:uncharacterized protein YigA (DUF484 family)
MNKKSREDSTAANLPDAQNVASYLKEHPQFFAGRDDLLLSLEIPHDRGHSVSLVERQVSLLREKNIALRRQLNDLVSSAKLNDETFSRSRKLLLAMLDASCPEDFFAAIEDCLKNDFKCSGYRLLVFSDNYSEPADWVSLIPIEDVRKSLPGLVENKKPVLGVLREEEMQYIFRDSASKVNSAAVTPLRLGSDEGFLALGNKDPQYFHAGMGTIFLNFIVDVIARLLPLHLTTSAG